MFTFILSHILSQLAYARTGPDVSRPRDIQTLLNRVYVVPTRAELQPATIVHAVETQIGDDIDVRRQRNLSIGINYTKGDETTVTIRLYKLFVESGVEYQAGTYGFGAGATHTFDSFDFSGTVVPPPLELDVSGCAYVKVTEQATLGTPTGTLAVEYFSS